jgi:hypothetical protein
METMMVTDPKNTPAPTVQEPVAWIDSVMEQAQVFASAWSLVGGRFYSGNGLEDAEQAKAELRAMLTTPPATPVQEPELRPDLVETMRRLDAMEGRYGR